MLNSLPPLRLFIFGTRLGVKKIPDESTKSLSNELIENRLRHASGPVQAYPQLSCYINGSSIILLSKKLFSKFVRIEEKIFNLSEIKWSKRNDIFTKSYSFHFSSQDRTEKTKFFKEREREREREREIFWL